MTSIDGANLEQQSTEHMVVEYVEDQDPYALEELESVPTTVHDHDGNCLMANRLCWDEVTVVPTCAGADGNAAGEQKWDREDKVLLMVPWTPRVQLPVSPCTRAFFDTNLIDYDLKIVDGFYDPGRSWVTLPSLSYVMNHPELVTKCRETIVVDMVSDMPLRRFVERCGQMLTPTMDARTKIHLLSVMVSNFQGGWNTDLLPRSDRFVQRLRYLLGFNIVPIGQVQHGVCRHRAVLFKFLCDTFGLPCRLIRGNYHHASGDKEGHSWNVVLLDGAHYLCDVMHDPGMLYDVGCGKTAHYHRDQKVCGRISAAGPGLASLPIPPKTLAVSQVPQERKKEQACSTDPDGAALDCVADLKRQFKELSIVHTTNQTLKHQLQECQEELAVKEEQLLRLARSLLRLDPDAPF